MPRGVRGKPRPEPTGKQTLLQVTAPKFVAGCIAVDGRIEACAPILRKHLMWVTGAAFKMICERNGWTWKIVEQWEGKVRLP